MWSCTPNFSYIPVLYKEIFKAMSFLFWQVQSLLIIFKALISLVLLGRCIYLSRLFLFLILMNLFLLLHFLDRLFFSCNQFFESFKVFITIQHHWSEISNTKGFSSNLNIITFINSRTICSVSSASRADSSISISVVLTYTYLSITFYDDVVAWSNI